MLATTYNNLGSLLLTQREFDEALSMLELGLEIIIEEVGNTGLEVGANHLNLAHAKLAVGNLRGAEESYNQGMARFREIFPEDHLYVGIVSGYLGRLCWKKGELDRADQHFAKAISIQRGALPSAKLKMGELLIWYGSCLRDRGHYEEARGELREGLAFLEGELEGGSWRIEEARLALATCLIQIGSGEEAEQLLTGAHASLQEMLGNEDPLTQEAAGYLDRLQAAMSN